MTTGYIVDTFISLVNGISETITAVKEFLKIILEVNNNVMAILIQSTANFLSGIWAVLKFIYLVIYTLTVCVGDFVMELVNFMSAFLYLLWKVVLLFYSLLDLAFHFVECLCYFIWTGGKWTAETIKVSGQNLTENGLSTWKYFVLSLQEFTSSIIGGFAMIGACVQTSAIHIFQGFCLSYNYVCELMYDIDGKVKDMVRLCTDNIYFFVKDYLLNMPREAYLGMLVTILCGIICTNIYRILSSEGLTFPMQGWFQTSIISDYDDDDDDDVEYYDANARAEFSDDEDIWDITVRDVDDEFNDEYNMTTDVSDSSDSSDGEFSDEELEIDSDSDIDSIAASESEMSEINIQLPDVSNRKNMQRSATPARFNKEMSPEDLKRCIALEKEKRICVVCQDQNKSVLILPCRHMCLCVDCGDQIARSRSRSRRVCPLCRTKINTIMNVYM
ncbi:uncharacterized protein LOC128222725 [Mya arenaria]|uniref:uncharacterized protein LOC128222710 n=1 Tax=Mya arenaria TaxID=6604 RepID=UPI0022E0CB5E|nr:uncharacterized protein LOC128222710 [Mya arenaria]XP_052787778.1 uncharacterized protein LOC128222725 [Mya arenaria]